MKSEMITQFDDKPYPFQYLTDEDVVRFFKKPTLSNRLVSIDIETYAKVKGTPQGGLVPKLSKIRTLQMYDGEYGVILDFLAKNGSYTLTNPWIAEQLQKFLLSKNLVAHNALFETAHLQQVFAAHYGSNKPLNIKCTMQMYKLLMHALTDDVKGLKSSLGHVAGAILEIELDKEEQMSDWSVPELTDSQLRYCAIDAIVPHQLINFMAPHISKYEMQDVYMLNTRAQEAVAHMKTYGIAIDRKQHKKLIKEWEQKQHDLKAECLEMLNEGKFGLTKKEYYHLFLAKVVSAYLHDMAQLCLSLKGQCDFSTVCSDMRLLENQIEKETDVGRKKALKRVYKNMEEYLVQPTSSKQLSDWALEHVDSEDLANWPVSEKSGNLKMGLDILDAYTHIPVIEKLVEFSEFNKLANTYGRSLESHMVTLNDGVSYIFPNFTLLHTGTGRMSSFEPNLQNLPRDEEVRKMFIPRSSDRVFLCADYSQIELRVLAELSQDEVMLQAFADGKDLHRITAAEFARKKYNDVSKEERQGAKGINFGLIYGAGATTLQKYCKVTYGVTYTLEEAQHAVDVFRELYPGVRDWQLRTARKAEMLTTVRTPVGKLRMLPEGGTYCASMNTRVQGGAGEIMLQALINYWTWLQENPAIDAYLVNVVHDEKSTDAHKDDAEEVKDAIVTTMNDALQSIFPEASLRDLVEVKMGNNWAEAK